MNIKVFKLNSGEEIVAKVVNELAESYTVEKPLGIAMTQQGLQMVPSLFTNDMDKEVEIFKNAVSMSTTPRTDVEEGYIQATTGISGAGSKQIITG